VPHVLLRRAGRVPPADLVRRARCSATESAAIRVEQSAFPSAARSRAVAANAHVVVIADDDESIRSSSPATSSLGYRIRVAADPYEALDLAQESEVRVLITDALMPRMDDRELCKKLKDTRAGARKKVIVMTSSHRPPPPLRGLPAIRCRRIPLQARRPAPRRAGPRRFAPL
jgi:CheY-like chemotaxis protein